MSDKELDYATVTDNYARAGELIGRHSSDERDAWLNLNGVWWPNPNYTGKEVIHPELVNNNE